MATLQNFLDIHEIPYLRFDGKKKGASLPTGWDKLSYEKSMKLNKNRKGKYMNVNWKGSKYFVVDIGMQSWITNILQSWILFQKVRKK